MDSKPPTSQLRGGEQNLEALSQTFNTIVQECKVIFYRVFSHFNTETAPYLLIYKTFLFVTEILNKMSKSALQDNTNKKKGKARGISNIKPVKSLILSVNIKLFICCLLNFLINPPMQKSLKIVKRKSNFYKIFFSFLRNTFQMSK